MSYSARKRIRALWSLGDLRYWFQIHMLLGVLGPIAILFHCNFRLGSVNSSIALVSMLLVSGSGLIGRFLYTKIHYGLYGRRATLAEIRRAYLLHRERVRCVEATLPTLERRLERFEGASLARTWGPLHAVARLLLLGHRARRTCAQCRRDLRRAARAASGAPSREEPTARVLQASGRLIAAYVDAVRRVAEFTIYERLFALWHAFHVPLFIILVVSALAHVVAVHRY